MALLNQRWRVMLTVLVPVLCRLDIISPAGCCVVGLHRSGHPTAGLGGRSGRQKPAVGSPLNRFGTEMAPFGTTFPPL